MPGHDSNGINLVMGVCEGPYVSMTTAFLDFTWQVASSSSSVVSVERQGKAASFV